MHDVTRAGSGGWREAEAVSRWTPEPAREPVGAREVDGADRPRERGGRGYFARVAVDVAGAV